MPTLTCMRVREGAIVLEAYTDIDRYADPVRLDEPAGWWQAAVAHLVGEATRSGPDGPPPRVDATSHRAR
jgi:hypothetical protein